MSLVKKHRRLWSFVLALAIMLSAAVIATGCDGGEDAAGTEAATYTLTYIANGQTFSTVTAEAGAAVADPGTPKHSDSSCVFEGWYLTPECDGERQTVPTTMPEGGQTYYAYFARYAILEITNAGGHYSREYTLAVGANVTEYLRDKEPAVEGLIFGGFFVDGEALADGMTLPATGLTVTAKFKVGYTINAYKQNLLGNYSATPEVSTGSGWVDEAVNADIASYPHFTVDVERSEFVTLTKDGANVISVYLIRNSYSIEYDSNAPNGMQATGAMPSSSAVYEQPVTVSGNGYSVAGYLFAGWAKTADGEVDADYAQGEAVLLENNVTLYAQWDRGYTDRFGGNDLIYQPRGELSVVYLERGGLETKQGAYNQTTRVFTFTLDDQSELKGRLSADGSFAYYGDENPGTYKLVNAYDVNEQMPNVTLVLDNYDGATVTLANGTQYTGRYTVDDESGDFMFIGDADVPDTYREFYFMLGTVGTTDVPSFAIRGEEYGLHYSYDPDSGRFTLPIIIFDGYGTAMVLTSATGYGLYSFTDDYATSHEIELTLLSYNSATGEFVLSEPITIRLDGKTTAIDTETGETSVVGLITVRDDMMGEYRLEGEQSVSLTLDGYGAGAYNGTAISYTLDGDLIEFRYDGQRTVLKLDNTEYTYDAQIGEEQGRYYLYLPHEKTLYTTQLVLDGQGNAVWYAEGEYSQSARYVGIYEYDAQHNTVECTSSDGRSHVVFVLKTVPMQGTEYPAYMQPVTLDGETYAGTYTPATGSRLTLDGYGNATLDRAGGEYTLEKRSGFTEIFVIFYVDAEITRTFKIDPANSSCSETDYSVGEYSEFAYTDGGYRYGTHSLVLKENGAADLYDRPRSWESKKYVGAGAYSQNAATGVYTFTLDDGVEGASEAERSFNFILTHTGNGTRVYKTFDPTLGSTYTTEDGSATLEFDGFGNATYSENGNAVVSSAFELSWGGVYILERELQSGETEIFKFATYEKDGETYFMRAGDEARIYTLYDPTGRERQQIIINGIGDAELYAYSADDERYSSTPFVKGKYERTDRDGEWLFISDNKNLSPDFKFILPATTALISYMKYDAAADGKFYCTDWTVLIIDGYCGHYTGATYTDAVGRVYEGTYTAAGDVITFESGNSEFYLRLMDEQTRFKRLGDERGEYMYYTPVSGALYSYPMIFLDGEGGATLTLGVSSSVYGRYALYGASGVEYTFTYEDGADEVVFRFRTDTYGNRKTFLLHEDYADGAFNGADGATLVIDGYSNAVYTDPDGVEWTGYYLSANEIPNSDGNNYLVGFVGMREGGSSSNEEDVTLFYCQIAHDEQTFKRVGDEAGFYYQYNPATTGVYQIYLMLDGDGVAYLQKPDLGGAYDSGAYTIDIETAEGEVTFGGETTKFRLTYIQTSLSNEAPCFILFDEDWAGTFTATEVINGLGTSAVTLELDGFGEGALIVAGDGEEAERYYGIITVYETEYISDPTVVFTVVVDGYAQAELFFKVSRANASFKNAGDEVNYYYGYYVSSSGGYFDQSVRLLLDGDGKAELYDATSSGLELNKTGTYAVKSDNGGTVTFTFTATDGSLTFDFQFRYVQEYFMGGYVPCYIAHDVQHAGMYSAQIGEDEKVTHTLELDGYELATYTYGDTEVSGTYYVKSSGAGTATIVFTARDEKGASYATATFTIHDDGSLEINSALSDK